MSIARTVEPIKFGFLADMRYPDVGQRFIDRFEAVYGRRPEYFAPVVCRDDGPG